MKYKVKFTMEADVTAKNKKEARAIFQENKPYLGVWSGSYSMETLSKTFKIISIKTEEATK